MENKIIWQDRKHFMWFPISFTKYEIKNDRLYQETGLFSTHYDELLLYRITDLCLRRNLSQKIFGTGTVILYTNARDKKKVVGKEFFDENLNFEDHSE